MKTVRPDPVKEGEGYNGYTNWDTWNTLSILENSQMPNNWLDSWAKNFRQKEKGGRFDMEAARYAVLKYIVPTARGKGSHAKDFKQYERDFTSDESIDPNNVNLGEIVEILRERGRENEKYQQEKKVREEKML